MGRKSVAEIRRQEILDAFEKSINTWGFHQSSTRKIAGLAGVKQPVIAYYFGNKATLVEALVSRIEAHYTSRLAESLKDARGPARIERALDFLFGPEVLGEGAKERALGQLLAAARQDEELKAHVIRMYDTFLSVCETELRRALPGACPERCRQVAWAVLCLGMGNDVLVSLGLAFANRKLARACAEQLISGLQP